MQESKGMNWLRQAQTWKFRYDIMREPHDRQADYINSYDFLSALSSIAPSDAVVVVDMGTSFTATHQVWRVKKGQRLLSSGGHASMGFGIPGAIGAHYASGKPVICIVGDGGLMMNVQSLQVVASRKLPIAIFLLNNEGYLTIKLMQRNHFGRFVGSTAPDVTFPKWLKISDAFNLPYYQSPAMPYLKGHMQKALDGEAPFLYEIIMHPQQMLIPRNTSERRPDGTIVSKPIEDMYPFLDREEMEQNMIIPMVEVLE